MWTVWKITTISGDQIVYRIETAYPDDHQYVHAYQQIAYRGHDYHEARSIAGSK